MKNHMRSVHEGAKANGTSPPEDEDSTPTPTPAAVGKVEVDADADGDEDGDVDVDAEDEDDEDCDSWGQANLKPDVDKQMADIGRRLLEFKLKLNSIK